MSTMKQMRKYQADIKIVLGLAQVLQPLPGALTNTKQNAWRW